MHYHSRRYDFWITFKVVSPMSTKTLSAITLALTFNASSYAFADTSNEQDVEQLDTMVVTASRIKQQAEKIPGAVTVITAKEIEQQKAVSDDLTSIIATMVPSMTPSRQKMSNQGESLRGRNALILVDGVPQNNPLRNGNRYGYTIDPSMVEKIEVIAGASAAQGMGATGGIINYVTKSAKPGDHWKQTIGTRVTTNLHDDGTGGKVYYALSQFDNIYDFYLSGSWDRQGLYYDGNNNPVGMNSIQGETQDSTASDIYFKGGYNFGDDLDQRIEMTVNRYDIGSNDNYVAIKGDFDQGIPGTVEKGHPVGDSVRNEVALYNLKYEHNDFANGILTAQVFYQNYDAVFGDANWGATSTVQNDQGIISSDKSGFKLSYERYDLLDLDDSWVFGLDGLQDKTVQKLVHTDLNVTPNMEYQSLAPFIQADFLATEDLRLSMGARYETMRVKSSDAKTLWGYGYNDVIGGTNDYSETVFNLGAIYSLTDQVNLFAAFNQGFGLPDYGRVLRGNWGDDPAVNKPIDFNDLASAKPVVTDNYEIGANYTGEKLKLSASTYLSIAKNGANLVLRGDNYDVDRQKTQIFGYELSSHYQLFDDTALQLMYSHVEGRVDTNEDGHLDSDMDLKNLTPDRILLAVDQRVNDKLSGRLQYNYLFDATKEDNAVGQAQHFDGYGLTDLSARYDLGKQGRVSLGIENIFNKQYVNYFSQIRASDDYYFSGRGRTFSLNYELDF